MKKLLILATAMLLFAGCGALKNNASNANAGMSAGQGAGNAILALYNQYKADGNKYDYKNVQNALNTITLITNCEGLAKNYKDKTYLSDFSTGMIAGSLGLVNENNSASVTDQLVTMMQENEKVQETKAKTQNTAGQAADYVGTAAQYANGISNLLSMFAN